MGVIDEEGLVGDLFVKRFGWWWKKGALWGWFT